MKKKSYSFHRRVILAFLAVCIMLFIGSAQLLKVNMGQYSQAAAAQGQYILTLPQHRGTVFDRNLTPLTNLPNGYTAAVCPTPQSITLLQSVLSREEYSQAAERLKNGKPILINISDRISADGITLFENRRGYSGLAPHIIGYTDASNHGKTGIEAAWDSLLYSESATQLQYSCDALGRVLPGVEPQIINQTNSVYANGVVLTLDSKIQRIVEEETENMGCGAAVVLNPQSGEILALHSFPAFSQTNPAASLSAPDSPFLNRALKNYNAGSVFKSFVAAAALEEGFNPASVFNCSGHLNLEGKNFVCNKSSGHGDLTLNSALAHSCNVYFYNLALETRPEKLISTAERFGFSQSIFLSRGLTSDNGILPSASKLSQSGAAVANYAIGQGDIMISPLNLAAAYAAIANGGTYNTPYLVSGTCENGKFNPSVPKTGEQVLSAFACNEIKAALEKAVLEGTGISAKPENCTAAGKTATAQTGWVKNGKKILISWFAGYFPAEKPEYVVVLLKEDGTSGSADCAPVFKRIADRIIK